MYTVVLYYLWIAPHVILGATAWLIFTRRLHKRFPVFFAYTVYETFVFLLLFTCYLIGHGLAVSLYRYAFVATLAGSTALRFGIIQEIFNSVFGNYPRIEKLATTFLRVTTGLLVMTAILSVYYSSVSAPDNLMVGIRLLERAVTIIQAGLLLFLFVFARLFGLSWRSFTFGIALGFAIFSSTELAKWTLEMNAVTERSKELLDLIPTGSYHISVLVWLGYLLRAEKPADPRALGPSNFPGPDIDQWSGELERSR